jgi:hypothetical protein
LPFLETSYLYEEVNCTELFPQLVFPVLSLIVGQKNKELKFHLRWPWEEAQWKTTLLLISRSRV